jgi:methionine-S-sulfoxide reductase
VPEKSVDGWTIATFGGGCFWGTELHFQRVPGVIATCVGYTQGKLERPTYNEVCGGRTGHTEATMVIYDPAKVTYGELVEKLLSTVDPTLKDQVGNDYGSQYRHGLYAHSKEQLEEARAILAQRQAALPKGRMIHTECKMAAVFWPAEVRRAPPASAHNQAATSARYEPARPLSAMPSCWSIEASRVHTGVSPAEPPEGRQVWPRAECHQGLRRQGPLLRVMETPMGEGCHFL